MAIQNGTLVDTVPINSTAASDLPLDDRIRIAEAAVPEDEEQQQAVDEEPVLNGRIKAPEGFPTLPCGTMGLLPLLGTLLGLWGLK
ncbi:MAG: hypothetical protein GTO03_11510, partial [Planctomycetales bacterium]|nr:hypothetical protein [Planctomycetales bacterium]